VELEEVPDEHRLQSDDPDYWDVWTGRTERPVDWAAIARDWSREAGEDSGNADIVGNGGEDLL